MFFGCYLRSVGRQTCMKFLIYYIFDSARWLLFISFFLCSFERQAIVSYPFELLTYFVSVAIDCIWNTCTVQSFIADGRECKNSKECYYWKNAIKYCRWRFLILNSMDSCMENGALSTLYTFLIEIHRNKHPYCTDQTPKMRRNNRNNPEIILYCEQWQ